jgi:hypothetical protein
LTRRHPEIQQCAADTPDSEFIENGADFAKIPLSQRHAGSEVRQALARVLDGVGILIQAENVRACAQDSFGMSTPATRGVDNE